MTMERVLLKIAYDGTAYHGWQVQPNGITVQEVLGLKLEQMFKAKVNFNVDKLKICYKQPQELWDFLAGYVSGDYIYFDSFKLLITVDRTQTTLR